MVKIWVQPLWCQVLELGFILTLGTFSPFSPERALAQNSAPINPPPPRANPIPPRRPEQPVPVPQTPPESPLDLPSPSPPPPEERPDLPGNVTVTKFEFEGNTAFSDRVLSTVTAPFTQRPITFAELLQAEAAITKYYIDAGYINSGAVIPSGQSFAQTGAVVKIQVIEGGLEAIHISGTKRLKPSYVRRRIKLATAAPLNQKKLLKALQVLQLDPLIDSISADLSAGSSPDLSILNVRVKEAKSFKTDFFADNGRTPSVGSFRRGMRVNQGNLLGYGDALSLEFANTTGSNAFNASYKVPVNARNGTIAVSGGVSFTNVIEKPFNSLDITGDSAFVDLTYRQPIVKTPTQDFTMGLTVSGQESRTQLLGGDYPLSPGSDESGRTQVAALRFFQDWTRRRTKDVIAVHSQFNFGGVLNDVVNTGPASQFFSWRAQGQYVRLLAPDTLFVVRSDLQLSADPLVPFEQFALGGQQSVRGYRQDALLTDNGFSASAEVRFPILRVKRVKGVLQIAPFVDFGTGWNHPGKTDAPTPNTLAGVGVGLQWQMGDWLTARFDWGIPLTDLDGKKKSLQEQGLYFSINYSPF